MAEITVFFAVRPGGETHGHFEAPPESAEALRRAVLGSLRCRVVLDVEQFRAAAEAAGVPPGGIERTLATLHVGDGLHLQDGGPDFARL